MPNGKGALERNRFQLRLDILSVPEVRAFLDAVNRVMNGNTFLIFARDQGYRPDLRPGYGLWDFLRSQEFPEAMYQVDCYRHRDMYHDWMAPEYPRRPGTFLKEPATAGTRPMSLRAFDERLHWMLRTCRSPYNAHVEEERAQILLVGFVSVLLGGASEENGRGDWCWKLYDVRPDFLHSTGYFDRTEPPSDVLPYFDGSESDSCTLGVRREDFFLLLTNGSP